MSDLFCLRLTEAEIKEMCDASARSGYTAVEPWIRDRLAEDGMTAELLDLCEGLDEELIPYGAIATKIRAIIGNPD